MCLRSALCRAFFLALRERRCLSCSTPFVPPEKKPEGPRESVPEAFVPTGRSAEEGAGAAALFCPQCLERLARRRAGFCPHCGAPAAWPLLPPAPCGRCLERRPVWNALIFHGVYEDLLRALLLRLKFGNRLELARGLGQLLATHPALAQFEVDVLVPVPLHVDRLRERGYNQALELARALLRGLSRNRGKNGGKSPGQGLPLRLEPGLLHRVRATLPQRRLPREERSKNLEGAFQASSAVQGRCILLVDDIMTTGATLDAATRAFFEAGAAAVYVVVVGRAALRYS